MTYISGQREYRLTWHRAGVWGGHSRARDGRLPAPYRGRGDGSPAKVQTGLGGPSMAGSGAAGRGGQWSGQGSRVTTATATSLILPPAGQLGAREFGGGRGSGGRCRARRGERGVLLAARDGVLAAAAKGEL